MNMQNVKDLAITEGDVRTIHDSNGNLLWGRLAYDTKYAGDTFQQTYTGRNLLSVTTFSNGTKNASANGLEAHINDDGSITVTGRASAKTLFYLTKNDFTLSGNFYYLCDSINADARLEFACKVNGANAYMNSYGTGSFKNASESFEYSSLTVVIASGTEISHTFHPMIALGSSIAGWEPYVGGIPSPNPDYPQDINVVTGTQTVTVSDGVNTHDYTVALGSIELAKIGTYEDYIYKSGDDWYVHKEINKSLIDGSVGTLSRSSANRFNIDQIDLGWKKQSGEILCLANSYVTVPQYSTNSAFNNGTADMEFALGLHPSSNSIRIKDSDYDDVTAYQNWLSSNPISLYYVLATATDTQITDSTLIAQLNAIHEWLTRYGYNSTVSGNLPLVIEQTNLS